MTEPRGESGSTSFLDSLGPRGVRRAEPRTSIAIAGAGCALAILGVLVVAGDTGIDESSGDFNKVPGIILTALVVAAGFFLLASVREGPLATAGSAAAAIGIPPLVFFLTFDQNSLPPYSTEGILIASTGVWLAVYAVGPGRGRPFFLGAGLLGLWLTVLQLTENLFDSSFDAFNFYSASSFDGTEVIPDGFDSGASFDEPDPTTIGLISLLFGIAFLLAGRRLDKGGRYGIATPFAVAALPCLVVGVSALVEDLEQAGSGLLTMLIGAGLTFHGATVARRLTTWLGAAATVLGAGIFLGDMTDDATIGGMLFIAAGIGLVFAGHAVAAAINEPDEMVVTVPASRWPRPAQSRPSQRPPMSPHRSHRPPPRHPTRGCHRSLLHQRRPCLRSHHPLRHRPPRMTTARPPYRHPRPPPTLTTTLRPSPHLPPSPTDADHRSTQVAATRCRVLGELYAD